MTNRGIKCHIKSIPFSFLSRANQFYFLVNYLEYFVAPYTHGFRSLDEGLHTAVLCRSIARMDVGQALFLAVALCILILAFLARKKPGKLPPGDVILAALTLLTLFCDD